jgi:hypothetical protein
VHHPLRIRRAKAGKSRSSARTSKARLKAKWRR